MAIQYFGTFPTIEYNLEKDETDAKTVVDITKRVGIRSDFSEHIGSYYKKLVTDGRRPEIYALSAYGSVLNHWILLHVNEVVDPYFDWVLDYAKFDAYIQKRYPDEVLIYDITSANQYGKNFVIGETPLFPSTMLFHASEILFPTGDIIPIPVITTLLLDIILPM